MVNNIDAATCTDIDSFEIEYRTTTPSQVPYASSIPNLVSALSSDSKGSGISFSVQSNIEALIDTAPGYTDFVVEAEVYLPMYDQTFIYDILNLQVLEFSNDFSPRLEPALSDFTMEMHEEQAFFFSIVDLDVEYGGETVGMDTPVVPDFCVLVVDAPRSLTCSPSDEELDQGLFEISFRLYDERIYDGNDREAFVNVTVSVNSPLVFDFGIEELELEEEEEFYEEEELCDPFFDMDCEGEYDFEDFDEEDYYELEGWDEPEEFDLFQPSPLTAEISDITVRAKATIEFSDEIRISSLIANMTNKEVLLDCELESYDEENSLKSFTVTRFN